jgi:CheY-specific phosphatase CheX
MTTLDLTQALSDSIPEILGTMFFSDVMEDCEDGAAAAESIAASLVFHGPMDGGFRLRIDLPAARLLASSFLAEEEDALAPEQIEEAVCELANMICGGALTRLQPDGLYSLSHPEIMPAADVGTLSDSDGVMTRHTVCLDGGRLTACMAFRE